MKEIERLKREMMRENQVFGLPGIEEAYFGVEADGEEVFEASPPTPHESNSVVQAQVDYLDVAVPATPDAVDLLEDAHISRGPPTKTKKGKKFQPLQPRGDEVLNGEHVERTVDTEPQETVSAQPELTKRDKRKLRQAKKAPVAEAQQSLALVCNVCKQPFESRTKLFNHIRDMGHALAEPNHRPAQNRKGERRKR